MISSNELTTVKTHFTSVEAAANAYRITSNDDLAIGADLLSRVKEGEAALTARKEEITRPLMDGLASARDLFKPLENGYVSAKKTIKDKMLAWQEAEDSRVSLEKARLVARVNRGTMRADTAMNKIETIGSAPTSAQGAVGKISTRTILKVRITDEALLPREYLIPDLKLITDAVLRNKQVVPGVETYEEKSIVSR